MALNLKRGNVYWINDAPDFIKIYQMLSVFAQLGSYFPWYNFFQGWR